MFLHRDRCDLPTGKGAYRGKVKNGLKNARAKGVHIGRKKTRPSDMIQRPSKSWDESSIHFKDPENKSRLCELGKIPDEKRGSGEKEDCANGISADCFWKKTRVG